MSNIEQNFKYEPSAAPISLVAELIDIIEEQQKTIDVLGSIVNNEDAFLVKNTTLVSMENNIDFV